MIDEYSDDEITNDEWALFAAQSMASELADEREDIYSLDNGLLIPREETHGP